MKELKIFILLIFGLLATTGITACSDDNEEIASTQTLVGNWKYKRTDPDGLKVTMQYLFRDNGSVTITITSNVPEYNKSDNYNWFMKGDLKTGALIYIGGKNMDEDNAEMVLQAKIIGDTLVLSDDSGTTIRLTKE